MAVTYGFYNSIDNDRVYDADQFSSFLDGIVYDGVYGAVGDRFYVSAVSGGTSDYMVMVGSGRAWFNHTWTLNDAAYLLTADEPDLMQPRIDAVVLEIDKVNRVNSIKMVKGEPADVPSRPELSTSANVYQYALAYIARPVESTEITQSDITYVVDTDETPLCSALSLAGIPSGGKTGQVLAKRSGVSGAVGWYWPEKLPMDDWFIPSGVSEDNLIAAFTFKGADSEDVALTSINSGTKYVLSKTNSAVQWNASTGFYIPSLLTATYTHPDTYVYGFDGTILGAGLDNTTLYANTNIRTVIIKYADATSGGAVVQLFSSSMKSSSSASNFRTATYSITAKGYKTQRVSSFGTNNVTASFYGYPIIWPTSTASTAYSIPSLTDNSGVISATIATSTPSVYFDKVSRSLVGPTTGYARDTGGYSPLIGNPSHVGVNAYYKTASDGQTGYIPTGVNTAGLGSVYIHAIALYNIELSATQVISIQEVLEHM